MHRSTSSVGAVTVAVDVRSSGVLQRGEGVSGRATDTPGDVPLPDLIPRLELATCHNKQTHKCHPQWDRP